MALDIGEKRIGLAVSNSEGTVALSAGYLEYTDPAEVMERIRLRAEQESIETLVYGLPLNQHGEPGEQAGIVESFIEELSAVIGLPMEPEDERYTSKMAESAMREMGTKRRRKKKIIDTMAAVIMLQNYLDRQTRID